MALACPPLYSRPGTYLSPLTSEDDFRRALLWQDTPPGISMRESRQEKFAAAARAVLEHVTRALVDDPDSVVVEVSEGRSGLRFSVHVAQGDMGRLIGRKGRTAQAIRTLVRAAAASEGTEASVDIVD